MRFMLDPILYFYMFWIPKFLNNEKGVKIDVIGKLFWIPFLALGISNIFGGYLSDLILRKTNNLNLARKSIMGFAALLTIPAAFVVLNPSTDQVIVIMVIVFFAHGMWITNYITSISDVFGKSLTSTVVGLSGTAGALSSVIINPLMGRIINGYTYDPLWIYSGVMYGVVFIFFIYAMPKIAPLKMEF
jgi:ACS family hexuronate transporter-like MFS transporter